MLVDMLREYMRSVGIEYYGVLDYSDCRVTYAALAERDAVVPRSAIIYLLPYYAGETVNISRYAASLDYHLAIREINRGIISLISSVCPNARSVGYGDHSPIDERHAALSLGLGIKGDNGLLINEKYGSYVFLGDVLTDIEPSVLGAVPPSAPLSCHHCGACRNACPTGILRGESEECLSAITQRKGELSESEAELMRKFNTVWGCDLCQSSCPYNREPRLTPIEFFYRDRIVELDLPTLDELGGEELRQRAFGWRGRAVLRRNLELLRQRAQR